MSSCTSRTVSGTPSSRAISPGGTTPWRHMRRLAVAGVLALAAIPLTGVAATASDDRRAVDRPCEVGVFCTWNHTDYTGRTHSLDLRTTNMEECVTLPAGDVRSFVNRLGRPVTVYQDAQCATFGDFTTYPGGTYVPGAPFVVRAIQIWTH